MKTLAFLLLVLFFLPSCTIGYKDGQWSGGVTLTPEDFKRLKEINDQR